MYQIVAVKVHHLVPSGYKVLNELLPYAEEWSGMKLLPHRAYGFRAYRNESQLLMHIDQVQTDIISYILHINSEKAEPWPIFIEDFNGQTHEIIGICFLMKVQSVFTAGRGD